MQCNLPLAFELMSKFQVLTFGARVGVEALSSDLHMTRLSEKYYTNQTKHNNSVKGTTTTTQEEQ